MAKPKDVDAEPLPTFSFSPISERQREVVEAWKRSRILFLQGAAGGGKTFLALSLAVQEALRHKSNCRKITLCRPLVQCDEDIGFLPGDLSEKLGPWMAPFRDVASSAIAARDPWIALEKMLNHVHCQIELVPLGMLRGRTISYGTLILDESQNASYNQLMCAMTRIGTGGRIIVCSDPSQRDRHGSGLSPVEEVARRLEPMDAVNVVRFQPGDSVRDPLIEEIIGRLG